MSEKQFSAATNKFAFAQGFAGPTARRHPGQGQEHVHLSVILQALRARRRTGSHGYDRSTTRTG